MINDARRRFLRAGRKLNSTDGLGYIGSIFIQVHRMSPEIKKEKVESEKC